MAFGASSNIVRIEREELDKIQDTAAKLRLKTRETSGAMRALTDTGARVGRTALGVAQAAAIGAGLAAVADAQGRILGIVPQDAAAAVLALCEITAGIALDSEATVAAGTSLLSAAAYSASNKAANKGRYLVVPVAKINEIRNLPAYQALPIEIRTAIEAAMKV
jgi:hypothetical protein